MTANSTSFDKWDDGSASGELTAVLDKLGEIARAASKGSFVFRGEPKCYPEISSSLYRQYKTLLEPFGVDGFDIRSCWQPAKMAQCETREIRGRIGVS